MVLGRRQWVQADQPDESAILRLVLSASRLVRRHFTERADQLVREQREQGDFSDWSQRGEGAEDRSAPREASDPGAIHARHPLGLRATVEYSGFYHPGHPETHQE